MYTHCSKSILCCIHEKQKKEFVRLNCLSKELHLGTRIKARKKGFCVGGNVWSRLAVKAEKIWIFLSLDPFPKIPLRFNFKAIGN